MKERVKIEGGSIITKEIKRDKTRHVKRERERGKIERKRERRREREIERIYLIECTSAGFSCALTYVAYDKKASTISVETERERVRMKERE